MERILVIINGRRYRWEALGRAVALAKRINARVYILMILQPGDRDHLDGVEPGTVITDMKTPDSLRLECIIQQARADSVKIEYFVTEGEFEEEVIRFVENNKISILVVEQESWDAKCNENNEKGLGPYQKIMYRISCRVELVMPKKRN